MVDKYQALTAGLTTEELTEFSRSFRAELFAEGLVQGNFSSAVSGQQTAHSTQTSILIDNNISWLEWISQRSRLHLHQLLLGVLDIALVLGWLPLLTLFLSYLSLFITLYCISSTGVCAVSTICHRVSQLLHWMHSLMRTPILYNQIDLFAIIRRDSHQLQLFSPWFAFRLRFFPSLLFTFSLILLPSLLVSCLAVSCSSPSWQRRYRWCSEWSSFHRSTTSVRSNRWIKETPTQKSLFTTRYTHTQLYMHVYRSSIHFISEGSFFVCTQIHSHFLSVSFLFSLAPRL